MPTHQLILVADFSAIADAATEDARRAAADDAARAGYLGVAMNANQWIALGEAWIPPVLRARVMNVSSEDFALKLDATTHGADWTRQFAELRRNARAGSALTVLVSGMHLVDLDATVGRVREAWQRSMAYRDDTTVAGSGA